MNPRLLLVVLAVVLASGGSLAGGYYWGLGAGEVAGFDIGVRRGRVEAARERPPQARDRGHSAAALADAGAWSAVDALAPGEEAALVALLNRAPSPCRRQSRRGISLATSLVDGEGACAGLPEQVRLALAALRSFEDPEEVLSVLRVERRARPEVEGRPSRGNPDAEVVLVEWGDFQCPYCTRAQSLLGGLTEARADVRVVFKHMPLSFHEAALAAALAAEAAAEQDRFWEMHDALFDLGRGIQDYVEDHPDIVQLGRDSRSFLGGTGPLPGAAGVPFEDLATELGIDVARYRADFRSEAVVDRVRADLREARVLGVSGTPTFWIDNRRVQERVSVDMLSLLVDRASQERAWRFSWDVPPPPRGVEASDE